MIKRFIRYALLVFCSFVLLAWVLSLWRNAWVSIGYRSRWNPGVSNGYFISVYQETDDERDRPFSFGMVPSNPTTGNVSGMPGWRGVHYFRSRGPDATWLYVPLWMIAAPSLLLTAVMWYRPVRARLRRKPDTGFAVELKQPE